MSDRDERQRPKGEGAPPGDFVSDDLRHETARFLAEVKRRIKNSADRQREPKLGPQRRRSSR